MTVKLNRANQKNPFPSKWKGIFNNIIAEYQTLISTSTPLGSSNFIRASTVLGEEE